MSAEVPFTIIIKRVCEEEVEICALTWSDAEEEALKLPGVMEARVKWSDGGTRCPGCGKERWLNL